MNSSNETTNFSDWFCRPESSALIQVIKVLAYGIAILVSLIGNALVIAVVCKDRRMRTPVNFFVANKSVEDILITVFYAPRMISRTFLGINWAISGEFGHILCKTAPFTKELSASVSVLTVLLMVVDRIFAVLFPLERIITNRVAFVTIVFVWFAAIAVRSPMFRGSRFIIGEEGKISCSLEFDSEVASSLYLKFAFVMFYVLPLFFIVVLCSAVLVLLKKRKPVDGVLTNKQRQYKDRLKRTRIVMNMLFTIVSVFAVGWCLHFFLPILFLRFQTKVCKLVFPAFFLGQLTSAINPCIYLLYIENYRRGFREILNPLYKRCFNTFSSNSRVMPQDCPTVLEGQEDSNNASLTLATLDFHRTVSLRQIKVLPAATATNTTPL